MTENGGDESDNSQDVLMKENDIAKNKPVPRLRRYGDKNVGPFIVCVRAISKPLLSMKIIKFLHNTYKSKLITQQINEFKINVIFTPKINNEESVSVARSEANNFPTTGWSKACRIYIPERLVEVIGCVAWSPEEKVDEIMSVGEGKFQNVLMPSVKILDATRFEKIIEEAGKTQRREATNTVRVIFEGLLLPEFLNVDGLLIPIREFKRKQMFCETCIRYNHTKSHCNNKPHKPNPTDKKCMHCNNDDHQSGDKNCPRRKKLEHRDKINEKLAKKKTYAQMLMELDPNASENNDSSISNTPLDLGTRSQRKRHQQPGTSKTSEKETLNKKRRTENSNYDEESWADEVEKSQPPGFTKSSTNVDDDPNMTNDLTKIIKSFIVDLGLPPFILNLIIKFVLPIIDKIINQITTSFLVKMSQVGNE